MNARLKKALHEYGPNQSRRLALVALEDPTPFSAFWPMRFIQIFGGKRWSVSLCLYRTHKPIRLATPEAARFINEAREEPR